VYLGVGFLLVLLAFVALMTPGAPRARADVDLTVNPVMTRGPAGAPVTIVEFSDYQ
jgi:protein-disulfide isomerase